MIGDPEEMEVVTMTTGKTTTETTTVPAFVVGDDGRIYVGARAQALRLREGLTERGQAVAWPRLMSVLAREFEDEDARIELILTEAYETVDYVDQPRLMGAVLAFYGTTVYVAKNVLSTDRCGQPLTEEQQNYYAKQFMGEIVFVVAAIEDLDPSRPDWVATAGQVLSNFLRQMQAKTGRSARQAALAVILASKTVPLLARPPLDPLDATITDAEAVRLGPLFEEIERLVGCQPASCLDVVLTTQALARQAGLSSEQTTILLGHLVGRLLEKNHRKGLLRGVVETLRQLMPRLIPVCECGKPTCWVNQLTQVFGHGAEAATEKPSE